MYKNILVAVDPAHEQKQVDALAMARKLGDDANTEITALTVIEPFPTYLDGEVPPDIEIMAGEEALASLRKLTGSRSEIRTEIRHGRPGHEIVEFAKEHKVDCIIVASHRPDLSDYFLGSTAARVVRHAPCTVHVMR
jgi:nucleotide-binding universal stress UspA family protein